MTNIAINLVNETAKTVARTEAASNQQNADDPLFVTPPFWAWVVGVPLVIGALYHFARVSRDKRSAIVADKSAKERDRQAREHAIVMAEDGRKRDFCAAKAMFLGFLDEWKSVMGKQYNRDSKIHDIYSTYAQQLIRDAPAIEVGLPIHRREGFGVLVRKASGFTLTQEPNANPNELKPVIEAIDELVAYTKAA